MIIGNIWLQEQLGKRGIRIRNSWILLMDQRCVYKKVSFEWGTLIIQLISSHGFSESCYS